MRNIEVAFTKYTHVDKIRVAKFVTSTVNSSLDQMKARNGIYNTVLGLLIKGDINCAGKYIDPNGSLFDDEEQDEEITPERKPRQIHEIETGTIRTAQEEERAAEEARRKKEAEEAAEEEDEVVRTKSIYLDPMTLDDAITRMEALGHSFFVYLDEEDDQISVAYKRLDGGYGVIQVENKLKD
jgi:hypothetical protein